MFPLPKIVKGRPIYKIIRLNSGAPSSALPLQRAPLAPSAHVPKPIEQPRAEPQEELKEAVVLIAFVE